jgi:hypothetical protein
MERKIPRRTKVVAYMASILCLVTYGITPFIQRAVAAANQDENCFDLIYESKRDSAQRKGFNEESSTESPRVDSQIGVCAAVIKNMEKMKSEAEMSETLLRLIAELPGGLSSFMLSPESVPSNVIKAIDKSKINAMDDLVNPVHQVYISCRNGSILNSWTKIWGAVPSVKFRESLPIFCDRLDKEYSGIMSASSRNLLAMMEKSYSQERKSIVNLGQECRRMIEAGQISKERASHIRNIEIANSVDRFRMEYDPYYKELLLLSNNKLQASLIGYSRLNAAISDLNDAADDARAICVNVLINH